MACSALLFALLALACGSAAQPASSTAETQSPGVSQPSLVTVSVPLTCKLLDIDTRSPPDFSRGSCEQPCTTTGPLNYTVPEGNQLTVNIDSPTNMVVVGGSQTDSFMNDPVPGLNETTAPAPANPSSNITILGFTWSPTRAIFPTFQNGSSALLSVYAFDTFGATSENKTYHARACRFSFNISVTPAAEPPTETSQLYNSGAPSAPSVLRALPLAILVAAAVLAVTCLMI